MQDWMLSPQNRIQIEGSGLVIDYYTDVEMKITGTICRISFF